MKGTKSFIEVLLAIQTLVFCAATEDWSNQAFFQRSQEKYLANSVIQTQKVQNEIECGLFCMRDSDCASVNYKRSGKNQGVCELNNKTLENSPENALENAEFVHLVIIDLEEQNTQTQYLEDGVTEEQPNGLYNSSILKGKDNYVRNLTTWLNSESNWTLCYRATQHGWNSTTFHSLCDYKGPTVTIVGVGNYIFGGYSDVSWGGADGERRSKNSFLFSFENNDKLAPFKLHVRPGKEDNAIGNYNNYGPIFGSTCDSYDVVFYVNDDDKSKSFSNLGYTYQLPANYTYRSNNTNVLLAGNVPFTPTEVEVFNI